VSDYLHLGLVGDFV